MRIRTVGLPVLDQKKAFQFYTEKLGFQEKHNIDLGNGHRWITVVSPQEPDGAEVSLEPAPDHHEPTKVYQKALFDSGIPWTQFEVDNVEDEYKRLSELGVEFKAAPKNVGSAIMAILSDTCGNYIALVQML